MLQEKNNKLPVGCIRFGIFLFVLFILIYLELFIFIFIPIIFFTKEKGNKNTIDFNKLFKFIGILDCIKYIFHNEKIDIFERVKEKNIEKIKNDSLNRKIENLEKNKNTEILWERPKIEEKIKSKNSLSIDGFSPLKDKIKSTYSNKNKTSFNNGKSIWDDYESVIDIMNKKNNY